MKERTITHTDYIAYDGLVFSDEKSCIEYEKRQKKFMGEKAFELEQVLQENMHITYDIGRTPIWNRFAGYDETVYAISITNENVLEKVNEWGKCKYNSWEEIPNTAIGTIRIISEWDWDTWDHNSLENIKKEYCDAIDELCGKLLHK